MKGLKLVVNNPLGLSKDRYDPERDGISPTLLSKWKSCREKALLTLKGWKSRRPNQGQTFGTLIHAVLERVYTQIQNGTLGTIPSQKLVTKICREVEKKWREQNTKADSETLQMMQMMMLLAEAITPAYFTFWNKDLVRMDWYHLEQFVGSSQRLTTFGNHRSFLRGKLDGAFTMNKDKSGRLWLFETKTKSQIGEKTEANLVDIMPHETQTNLYLGALQDATGGKTPAGVLLNIVRRPALKLKKGESLKAFAARVTKDIQSRPDWYFLRLRLEIEPKDLLRQRQNSNALMSDFLAWYHGEVPHYKNSDQCEAKHGTCEFLKMCSRGDTSGMYQSKPRRGEGVEGL
jgi:hypothetical protein